MPASENLIELNQNYHNLLSQQKTLLLATASVTGLPEISYAPFVRDTSGNFYIYVSELAQHTVNLLQNPQASVLFVRDEAQSPNLFARERVVFTCDVNEVFRYEPLYNEQIQAMQSTFGQVIQVLASLNDFHLFTLSVQNGRYVAGFGKAYEIDIANNALAQLIRGK